MQKEDDGSQVDGSTRQEKKMTLNKTISSWQYIYFKASLIGGQTVLPTNTGYGLVRTTTRRTFDCLPASPATIA